MSPYTILFCSFVLVIVILQQPTPVQSQLIGPTCTVRKATRQRYITYQRQRYTVRYLSWCRKWWRTYRCYRYRTVYRRVAVIRYRIKYYIARVCCPGWRKVGNRCVPHPTTTPYSVAWVRRSVRLCYRWYPDGNGGQCGRGVGRLLCAFPNAWTTYYRDDTDGRSGGCQMSWGLQPNGLSLPTTPSWFRGMQICYNWYADGNGGQCSPTRGTRCAPVGHYTAYYRDDTDGRSGGCRMRWMLSVPGNAPSWLKAARLCYQWYPDGNGGQCGAGAPRLQCKRAGTWMSYYRDDTDGRNGGCMMRWSIRV